MTSQRATPTNEQLAGAIRTVQSELLWKPDSAERHLRRRIKREHLPADTTLDDYETLIRRIVHEPSAHVYLYWHKQTAPYVTVVYAIDGSTWLVMFNLADILESAYVVERPHYYLSEPDFELICTLGELA